MIEVKECSKAFGTVKAVSLRKVQPPAVQLAPIGRRSVRVGILLVDDRIGHCLLYTSRCV